MLWETEFNDVLKAILDLALRVTPHAFRAPVNYTASHHRKEFSISTFGKNVRSVKYDKVTAWLQSFPYCLMVAVSRIV